MYSMPNGEQGQDLEGEASGGDSGEWTSDGEEDGESEDSSDEEEVESSQGEAIQTFPRTTERL